tara:strand:- start:1526 stop:1942 length:417 start_codon:yes stop_codon:yes gene_type:complete
MGQRVNLQYTVDIDELPNETLRLVKKAHDQSKLSTCILSELAEAENILTMDNMECVEKARLALMNIDYALQDIQNIIKGYVAHKSGIDEQSQQQMHDVPTASLYEPGEVDIDQLEKHINNFKEVFEQQNSAHNDIAKE